MNAEIRSILKRNDVGDWESPDKWASRDQTIELIRKLKVELEDKFKEDLTIDENVQDASFITDIGKLDDRYYNEKTGVRTLLYEFAFRFSAFGRLATVHGTRLNEYRIEEMRQLIEKDGFKFLERKDLEVEYDGILDTNGEKVTWWVRYFDYV